MKWDLRRAAWGLAGLLCLGLSACLAGESPARMEPLSSASPQASSAPAVHKGQDPAEYRQTVWEAGLSLPPGNTGGMEEWIRAYAAAVHPDWEPALAGWKEGGTLSGMGFPNVQIDVWELEPAKGEPVVTVTVVGVRQEETVYLTGIYDETNAPFAPWDGETLAEYVRMDSRFAESLPSCPQEELPAGGEICPLSEDLAEYSGRDWYLRDVFAFENGSLLLIYAQQAYTEEGIALTGLEAVCYDPHAGQALWTSRLLAGEGTAPEDYRFTCEGDELRVAYTAGGEQTLWTLNRDGARTGEETLPAGYRETQDDAYFSYVDEETNCLYLVEKESGNSVCLFEGIRTENELEAEVAQLAALEEGKAVYSIYGYERTLGYGIYDCRTGENTQRRDGWYLVGVAGGKIHLSQGMEPAGYRYADLSDPLYTEQEIPGLNARLAEEAEACRSLTALSDGRIALFACGAAPIHDAALWVFDPSGRKEQSWMLRNTDMQSVCAAAGDWIYLLSGKSYHTPLRIACIPQ